MMEHDQQMVIFRLLAYGIPGFLILIGIARKIWQKVRREREDY